MALLCRRCWPNKTEAPQSAYYVHRNLFVCVSLTGGMMTPPGEETKSDQNPERDNDQSYNFVGGMSEVSFVVES